MPTLKLPTKEIEVDCQISIVNKRPKNSTRPVEGCRSYYPAVFLNISDHESRNITVCAKSKNTKKLFICKYKSLILLSLVFLLLLIVNKIS